LLSQTTANLRPDTEGRANEAEELKQKQLKNQKEGKGKWEEGLASDSESIVRIPSGWG
jgi:hypothetical protein